MGGTYTIDSNVVIQFLDCMLPFLEDWQLRKNIHFIESLLFLKDVFLTLGNRSAMKMLILFSSLLNSSQFNIWVPICDTVKDILKVEPSLAFPSKLVASIWWYSRYKAMYTPSKNFSPYIFWTLFPKTPIQFKFPLFNSFPKTTYRCIIAPFGGNFYF